MSARWIQARIKDYGDQTGVNKEVAASPHAFRRTFCRLKVEANTNIFVLQRLTGHHSLEILKRYVQIYGKDLEDVIEKGFRGYVKANKRTKNRQLLPTTERNSFKSNKASKNTLIQLPIE